MLLNEFFHFSENNSDLKTDRRYDSSRDSSIVKKSDTRKLRLTLRQINLLRQQTEAHEFEKESEVEFIKQMYGAPVEQPAE